MPPIVDMAMAIDLLIAPTLDTLLVVTMAAVAPTVPMDLMDLMAMVAILVTADCTRGRLRLPLKPMLRLESTMESPLTDTLLSPMELGMEPLMDLGMEPLMDLGMEPAMDILSMLVDTTTTTDMVFTRGLLMLATSDMLPTTTITVIMPPMDVVSRVSPGPSLTTASAFTTKHQPKYATNVKLVST